MVREIVITLDNEDFDTLVSLKGDKSWRAFLCGPFLEKRK